MPGDPKSIIRISVNPSAHSISPAEFFMGRRFCILLPVDSKQLQPQGQTIRISNSLVIWQG